MTQFEPLEAKGFCIVPNTFRLGVSVVVKPKQTIRAQNRCQKINVSPRRGGGATNKVEIALKLKLESLERQHITSQAAGELSYNKALT